MLLDEIKEKLEELKLPVFYGMAYPDVDIWDYIVFSRKTMSPGAMKKEYVDKWSVAIVRENFIPEGFEFEVINKMTSIPGIKLATGDFQYSYARKSADVIVELLVLDFVRGKKAVSVEQR